MAIDVHYKHPRGTRAALTTLAGANGLSIGQIYYLTDEQRLAVATSSSSFTTFAKQSEIGSGGGGGGIGSYIDLPSPASPPDAPAEDNVRIFGREVSGRSMPGFIGPSGLDTLIQPFLARNKIGFWNPGGNGNTVPGSFGLVTPTTLGTATSRVFDTANVLTRARRLGYVSAATAGSFAGLRNSSRQFSTSDGNGLGGFHFIARFAASDVSLVTGARSFIGFSQSASAPANADPTSVGVFGFGQYLSDPTQWYLIYGGSTGQPSQPLGASLGSPNALDTVYEAALFSSSKTAGAIHWQFTNIGTGATASGTISGDSTVIPPSSQQLGWQIWRSNAATALAVGMDIVSIYIESDT